MVYLIKKFVFLQKSSLLLQIFIKRRRNFSQIFQVHKTAKTTSLVSEEYLIMNLKNSKLNFCALYGNLANKSYLNIENRDLQCFKYTLHCSELYCYNT